MSQTTFLVAPNFDSDEYVHARQAQKKTVLASAVGALLMTVPLIIAHVIGNVVTHAIAPTFHHQPKHHDVDYRSPPLQSDETFEYQKFIKDCQAPRVDYEAIVRTVSGVGVAVILVGLVVFWVWYWQSHGSEQAELEVGHDQQANQQAIITDQPQTQEQSLLTDWLFIAAIITSAYMVSLIFTLIAVMVGLLTEINLKVTTLGQLGTLLFGFFTFQWIVGIIVYIIDSVLARCHFHCLYHNPNRITAVLLRIIMFVLHVINCLFLIVLAPMALFLAFVIKHDFSARFYKLYWYDLWTRLYR